MAWACKQPQWIRSIRCCWSKQITMWQQDLVISIENFLWCSPAYYPWFCLTISVWNCSPNFNFLSIHISSLVSLHFCGAGFSSQHVSLGLDVCCWENTPSFCLSCTVPQWWQVTVRAQRLWSGLVTAELEQGTAAVPGDLLGTCRKRRQPHLCNSSFTLQLGLGRCWCWRGREGACTRKCSDVSASRASPASVERSWGQSPPPPLTQ